MAGARITVKGSEELQRALRDKRLTKEPVRKFLERSAQTVEGRAKGNAPVDTGRLRSSISRDIQPDNRRAFVGSNLVYAAPVEFGRRPGKMPPVSALDPWARRRGLNAFLVARAIARRGTRPQPYLIPALNSSRLAIQGFLKLMGQEIEMEFRRRAK